MPIRSNEIELVTENPLKRKSQLQIISLVNSTKLFKVEITLICYIPPKNRRENNSQPILYRQYYPDTKTE